MKVLYLSTGCFDKGGISRYNRYQIQALRELQGEQQVRVLSLAGPKADDFETPFRVFWHGKGPDLMSKLKFTWTLLLQTLHWQPDVILIAHVNFAGLAVMISRLRRTKTILNAYGLEVWSGLKKLPDWGLRNVEEVIADCHYTARYLEASGFRKKNSVTVVWDCVDLTRFYPSETTASSVLSRYGIPDPVQHPLIITLGRIAKAAAHKGYDRLIKVFSAIHTNFPQARLILAGKGDLIPELKVLISELGLADKVIFTGMVEEQHLTDIYRAAYVFSLVSDRGKGRGEGIPLTPLEAMACGVPIIVGNQDGSQEAVVEEQNGYVIDPFDLDMHAQKLTSLLKDRALRNDKARQAIQIVNQYFSYAGFKEKHRQFLGSIFQQVKY